MEVQEVLHQIRRGLEKWLDTLADELKRLAEKAVEALPTIVGNAVGAILSSFGKAVGFDSLLVGG